MDLWIPGYVGLILLALFGGYVFLSWLDWRRKQNIDRSTDDFCFDGNELMDEVGEGDTNQDYDLRIPEDSHLPEDLGDFWKEVDDLE